MNSKTSLFCVSDYLVYSFFSPCVFGVINFQHCLKVLLKKHAPQYTVMFSTRLNVASKQYALRRPVSLLYIQFCLLQATGFPNVSSITTPAMQTLATDMDHMGTFTNCSTLKYIRPQRGPKCNVRFSTALFLMAIMFGDTKPCFMELRASSTNAGLYTVELLSSPTFNPYCTAFYLNDKKASPLFVSLLRRWLFRCWK